MMNQRLLGRISALEKKLSHPHQQLFVLRYDDPIPENAEKALIIRLHPKPTPKIEDMKDEQIQL